MLVYGDHDERVETAAAAAALGSDLHRMGRMEPGLERHSALVTVLIEAGRLHQGMADHSFREIDHRTPATDRWGGFVHWLARCVVRSWDSAGAELGDLPAVPDLDRAPREIQLRTPEGFAFYAVYPDAYADAARELELCAPPKVIGLRSIGTTLAAVTAAALGAPPAIMLRPFGDPSARRVALSDALAAELLAKPAHYVIVDEGPGLSGSSFNAVVDWLCERGVALDRIAVLPSHGGAPGASASAEHRAQWSRLQRVPAELGPRLEEVLGQWLPQLLGPLDGPLIDLSAGQWRRWAFACEECWPAVDTMLERRKFLVFADGETWLAKFAGLGAEGDRRLQLARRLYQAGLAPEPRGLINGFLVERWHGNATRLSRRDRPIVGIAHYIAARARLLSGCDGNGASIRELDVMARQNLQEAGLPVPVALSSDRLDALEAMVRRLPTDNRMQSEEWLRLPSGELLKSDALDHHRAHDLIGCQDPSWDVAGAIVEFDLDAQQADELRRAVEAEWGSRVPIDLLGFCEIAYVGFRIGQLQFAGLRAADSVEADRIEAAKNRLRRRMETEGGFVGSNEESTEIRS